MPTTDYAIHGSTDREAGNILNHVQIIDPDIGWWSGRFVLKDADTTVGGEVVDKKHITRPQVKLLEATSELREFQEKFRKLNSEACGIIDYYTETFPIRGLRMVPIAKLRNMMHELIGKIEFGMPVYDSGRHVARTNSDEQSVAYRFNRLADDFCQQWPTLVEGMQNNIESSLWSYVRKRLPGPDHLRGKFFMRVSRLQVNLGGTSDLVGALAMQSSDEYSDYMRDSLQRQIDEAVTQLVAGPRQALVDALNDLNNLIMRDGRVTTKSFGPVRDAIEKIRMFGFIANDELLNEISRLEQVMGVTTPSSLDSRTAVDSGFIDLIKQTSRTAADMTARNEDLAKYGVVGRAIMLD